MHSLCRKILPFIMLALVGKASAQQAGRVIEDNRIKSAILGKEVRYTVYLPADYERSERTYPVVYLLHGFTDDNTGWLQFGEINRYADKAIADGTIPPMIIVMPNGDSSWYINSVDGKEKYEDFFTKEFIPTVEKIYRINGQKKFRGIAGLSMGGYGTLVYSLKHPDLFAAAAPLSAWVLDDSAFSNLDNDFYEYGLRGTFAHGLRGKQRLNQHWYDNSVLHIVETKSADELRKVRYWIDCGDDDLLTKGNSLLHIALTDKKVDHEFRTRNGGHTWTYWRSGITDALQFIGWSFRQQ